MTSTQVAGLERKAENAGNELERRGPNTSSNFNLPQLMNVTKSHSLTAALLSGTVNFQQGSVRITTFDASRQDDDK